MKNLLKMFALAIISVLVVGCGSNGGASSSQNSETVVVVQKVRNINIYEDTAHEKSFDKNHSFQKIQKIAESNTFQGEDSLKNYLFGIDYEWWIENQLGEKIKAVNVDFESDNEYFLFDKEYSVIQGKRVLVMEDNKRPLLEEDIEVILSIVPFEISIDLSPNVVLSIDEDGYIDENGKLVVKVGNQYIVNTDDGKKLLQVDYSQVLKFLTENFYEFKLKNITEINPSYNTHQIEYSRLVNGLHLTYDDNFEQELKTTLRITADEDGFLYYKGEHLNLKFADVKIEVDGVQWLGGIVYKGQKISIVFNNIKDLDDYISFTPKWLEELLGDEDEEVVEECDSKLGCDDDINIDDLFQPSVEITATNPFGEDDAEAEISFVIDDLGKNIEKIEILKLEFNDNVIVRNDNFDIVKFPEVINNGDSYYLKAKNPLNITSLEIEYKIVFINLPDEEYKEPISILKKIDLTLGRYFVELPDFNNEAKK